MENENRAVIELKNIKKTYRSESVELNVLRDINLVINEGEFVAIMGPSGSGKSTLLHILGFLDRPDSGSYKFFGHEMTGLSDNELASVRNHVIGFVFQQFHLLRRASALENTELPLIYGGKRHLRQYAHNKLKDVGLENRKFHHPNQLSGGEQQRVAIARALVNDPVLIFADEPTGNLDTKSEKEIMLILKELNNQGKTIIMVTHENEVAQYAQRIIFVRDGDIISDRKNFEVTYDESKKYELPEAVTRRKRSSLGAIEFIDHIKQAYGSIFSNKLRSFLSMLGILIGVGSVIAMLALGQGAKESIEQRLKSLGSNLLHVRNGSPKIRGVAMSESDITRFNFSDVDAIRKIPCVKRASCSVRGKGQVVYENKNWNTQIEGVGFDYGKMCSSIPTVGRWFTEDEVRRRDKVAVIGATVYEELFGESNPIGKTIKINRLNFKVIGILPSKGADSFHDQDDLINIPVTTAMYRVLGKDYLDSIYAEARDQSLMDEAESVVRELIIKRHHIQKDPDDAFRVMNLSNLQETLESTTRTMGILLGCIAAISLLVGGIGIMNIMLVSVTERTREIGLRKAVGAREGDIKMQFMIESMVMTISGGIVGIILGVGTSAALTVLAGWATRVTVSNVMLALVFSVGVGIFFGIWPAIKASQLNPINALRYE